MKKRYLRRFLNNDDSFTGDYFFGKTIGMPFDIVTSHQYNKKDKIPRIHVITYNDENLAKLNTTKSYQILGPGIIKQIKLYSKDSNKQYETFLKIFTKVYYNEIINYFFDYDGNTYLDPEIIKSLI